MSMIHMQRCVYEHILGCFYRLSYHQVWIYKEQKSSGGKWFGVCIRVEISGHEREMVGCVCMCVDGVKVCAIAFLLCVFVACVGGWLCSRPPFPQFVRVMEVGGGGCLSGCILLHTFILHPQHMGELWPLSIQARGMGMSGNGFQAWGIKWPGTFFTEGSMQ